MHYELIQARPDGLFSNVYSVLGTIQWCEEHGTVPAVRFDSGPYWDPTRGPNWWEYFFERVSDVDPMTLPVVPGEEILQRSGEMAYRLILHRELAADLIRRHIRVRQEVQRGVEAFWKEHLGNCFVVGVHLRGTDKWLEVPEPDIAALFGHLESLVYGRPADRWRVFVATDEVRFLKLMQERLGDQIVCQDALRSENGQPLHKEILAQDWQKGPHSDQPRAQFVRQSPYRLGFEAIQDALLLARCHAFFGSSSNLSYFAAAYNPRLPWVHLSGIIPSLVYRDHLAVRYCAGRFDRLTEQYPALAELREKERMIQSLNQVAQERAQLIQTLHQAATAKEQVIETLQDAAAERLHLIEELTRRVRELEGPPGEACSVHQ